MGHNWLKSHLQGRLALAGTHPRFSLALLSLLSVKLKLSQGGLMARPAIGRKEEASGPHWLQLVCVLLRKSRHPALLVYPFGHSEKDEFLFPEEIV